MDNVFVSYGHADADWVRTLAENLHNSGLEVFFDEWRIGPGDVLIHKLDEGILTSRSGILVVSPESLSRPYVQMEYAAMMTRAVEGKQRLIPVLLKDAELPPFMATLVYVAFRDADGPDYRDRVTELIRRLKNEPLPPPRRTGELNLPPGSSYTTAGPRSVRLSIGRERTTLATASPDIFGPPPRPDIDVASLNWRLERARKGLGPTRDAAGAPSHSVAFEQTLEAIGTELANAFLPPNVTAALANAIAEAERLNVSLRLALDIAEPFADLPWETLRLPATGALALHPRVELYRRIASGKAPTITIPGPLRILVAIGSPEADNARGELLDMEAELRTHPRCDRRPAPRRQGVCPYSGAGHRRRDPCRAGRTQLSHPAHLLSRSPRRTDSRRFRRQGRPRHRQAPVRRSDPARTDVAAGGALRLFDRVGFRERRTVTGGVSLLLRARWSAAAFRR